MSSVSGCRLVDARCWLRILKPQASLLLLPRLIVVVATCFFAEGHERSHHAHVALLGRPWRRLTVPAAHHSEATIHRRGEAKIPTHLLDTEWSLEMKPAALRYTFRQVLLEKLLLLQQDGGRQVCGRAPLTHLCDRSVRNTEAVWSYCCSSYSRLSQWLWKEVNSGGPEKPRSHISNAVTWHLST